MRRLFVGFSCNNRCVFCAQGALRSRVGALDVEEVLRQIRAVEQGETVAFVGGEPTLRSELLEWVRAALEAGARTVVVQTNGRRLAYPSYARALAEAAPSQLVLDVSLQGSTSAMHDYHTSTEGSFRQTIQGLRNARAEQIPCGITTVVTRSNFRHLDDIVRLAQAAGARAIQLVVALPLGTARRLAPRVVPAPPMIRRYVASALDEARRLGLEAVSDTLPPASSERAWPFAGIGEVETP